jgi:hypothetical protein
MDPDPGGPKTCGSGSATLLLSIIIVRTIQLVKPIFSSGILILIYDILYPGSPFSTRYFSSIYEL